MAPTRFAHFAPQLNVLSPLLAAGLAHLRPGLTAILGIGRGQLTAVRGVVPLLSSIFHDNVSALHRYLGLDSTRRSSIIVEEGSILTKNALHRNAMDDMKVKARTVFQAEQPAQPISLGPLTTKGFLQNPPQ
jgi:hypothetical protein